MLLPLLLALSLPVSTPAPDALPPPGVSGPATAGAQLLVGGAVYFAATSVLNVVPLVGPVVSTLVAGVIVGGTETVVGDAIGQSRSPLLWPVVTSTSIFLAGGVTSVVVSTANAYSASDALYRLIVGGPVQTAIAVVTGIVGVAVPVIAYHLAAVPKEHDDPGGLSMPGILVPSDPTNSRDAPSTTPAVPANAPPPPSELIY